MQKQLQLQKTMMTLYIIIAVVAFSYSLCFMTAYKDLFGLMLKQNSNIAYFHDVFYAKFQSTDILVHFLWSGYNCLIFHFWSE